jgi:hypothetical protein
MCATSNSDACARQCCADSMMESLYWIGMDHPAKGTILPACAASLVTHCRAVQRCRVPTPVRNVEVVQGRLLEFSIVCESSDVRQCNTKAAFVRCKGSLTRPAEQRSRNGAQHCELLYVP